MLPERPPEPAASWQRDIGPDVVTNLTPKEGRLVVILLDHSIGKSNFPEARRTAEAAVEQLGPNDLAAVIYTSVGVPQNFTADRSLLRAAINQPFLGIDVDLNDPFGGSPWRVPVRRVLAGSDDERRGRRARGSAPPQDAVVHWQQRAGEHDSD